VRILLAQCVDDRQPDHPRHQDIGNDQVRDLDSRRSEGCLAISNDDDLVALRPQRARDEVTRLEIVVNDKDCGSHEADSSSEITQACPPWQVMHNTPSPAGGA
jgi:hypothetical protein